MRKPEYLKSGLVIAALREIAVKVKKENPNVEKIILFGSLVKNRHSLRSDADIIILLKESNERFIDRIGNFLFAFIESPVATDIFPYTNDEAKRNSFAGRAIAEGVVLA